MGTGDIVSRHRSFVTTIAKDDDIVVREDGGPLGGRSVMAVFERVRVWRTREEGLHQRVLELLAEGGFPDGDDVPFLHGERPGSIRVGEEEMLLPQRALDHAPAMASLVEMLEAFVRSTAAAPSTEKLKNPEREEWPEEVRRKMELLARG